MAEEGTEKETAEEKEPPTHTFQESRTMRGAAGVFADFNKLLAKLESLDLSTKRS